MLIDNLFWTYGLMLLLAVLMEEKASYISQNK